MVKENSPCLPRGMQQWMKRWMQQEKTELLELMKRQQQEQAAIKAKQLEATKAVEIQKQQQATAIQQQQQKKAAEAARQKQQAAAAAQKVADAARQKEQLALEKRRKEEDIERQKRAAAAAAAEAEIRQREFEAQRIAEAAAREAKKVQMMKEQLAATEARTRRESSPSSSSNTAIKANVAAARIATGTATSTKKSPSVPIQRAATPSRSVYSMKDTDTDASPALDGLARATISLFGLGKSELEELPAPKVKSPVTSSSKGGASTATGRRAPIGVPTVTRWRQNSDQTITGLVKGSRNFDDGSRITTSPITSGTIASGEVVKTGSGSRYFLE